MHLSQSVTICHNLSNILISLVTCLDLSVDLSVNLSDCPILSYLFDMLDVCHMFFTCFEAGTPGAKPLRSSPKSARRSPAARV